MRNKDIFRLRCVNNKDIGVMPINEHYNILEIGKIYSGIKYQDGGHNFRWRILNDKILERYNFFAHRFEIIPEQLNNNVKTI